MHCWSWKRKQHFIYEITGLSIFTGKQWQSRNLPFPLCILMFHVFWLWKPIKSRLLLSHSQVKSIWIDRSRYFPPFHCIISFPTLRNQTFLRGQERRLRAVSGISSQEQSHRVWLTLLMSSKYKYAVHFLRLADKAWHFPAVQEDSQRRGQAASSWWDCKS